MQPDCSVGIEHGYVAEEILWGQSGGQYTPLMPTLVGARARSSGIFHICVRGHFLGRPSTPESSVREPPDQADA
jgi:hypothetical protein